jgi:hypothetical protein
MSELIGGSDTYSTWASVRSPVVQGNSGISFNHSYEAPVGVGIFKTDEGNGLLRFDRAAFPFGYQPTVGFDDLGPMFFATSFVEPYDTKFVGETVTLTGPDTFNITAAAFVPPSYQALPSATGSNPITAIGLLTPV